MTKRRAITIRWLRSRRACSDQVALFRATFGESAELTRANLVRAAEACLRLWWLALRLLDTTERGRLDAALRPARILWRSQETAANQVYSEATREAWRRWRDAEEPAWRSFREVLQSRDDEAVEAARLCYQAMTAEARRAYDEATAGPRQIRQDMLTAADRHYQLAIASELANTLGLL